MSSSKSRKGMNQVVQLIAHLRKENPNRNLSDVELLIESSANYANLDGPSLPALLAVVGPTGSESLRLYLALTGKKIDRGGMKILKANAAFLCAALATTLQWLFAPSTRIQLLATFVVVYAVVEGKRVIGLIGDRFDGMRERLNVLRHVVATHVLNDETWKRQSGITLENEPRATALDVARQLVVWDGNVQNDTIENEARWKIMSDALDISYEPEQT